MYMYHVPPILPISGYNTSHCTTCTNQPKCNVVGSELHYNVHVHIQSDNDSKTPASHSSLEMSSRLVLKV